MEQQQTTKKCDIDLLTYKKKKPTELRIVILSAEATGQQWRIVFFVYILTRILGA